MGKTDAMEIQPLEKPRLSDDALAIPYAVEVKKPQFNALIWGPPGKGKTILAASAADHPDLGPALVLNIEGGLLSLGNRKNIDAVDITSFEQVEAYFWKISARVPPFDKYKTVIIDSGTELQTLSLEGVVRNEMEKARKKGGEAAAKRESLDEIFQNDYGKDSTRIKRIVRWFRDAPVNVIITALSKNIYSKPPTKDTEPQLLAVVPWFTDKLGQAIMGYVDFVWYLDTNPEGKRCLLTCDKGNFKGKTRGPNFQKAIGEIVVEPNLAKLYDALLQSEGNQK